MSRSMLKLVAVMVIGLGTATVGFAQRQPGSAGNSGNAGTARSDRRGGATDGATTAADRNGQTHNAKATFEVYKDKAGEYRWRLRATNTQILAMAAQGYSDKRSCLNAIESVKRDVADAPVEEKEAVAGKDDDKEGTAATAGSKSSAASGTSGNTSKKQAK